VHNGPRFHRRIGAPVQEVLGLGAEGGGRDAKRVRQKESKREREEITRSSVLGAGKRLAQLWPLREVKRTGGKYMGQGGIDIYPHEINNFKKFDY